MFLDFYGFCAFIVFGYLSFWVAGGGGIAEAEGGFIDFIEFQKFGGFFGHFAREKDEQAGSERVEGAGVADFDFVAKLGFEAAADFSDDTETADTSGFVDEDDLIFFHCIIITDVI